MSTTTKTRQTDGKDQLQKQQAYTLNFNTCQSIVRNSNTFSSAYQPLYRGATTCNVPKTVKCLSANAGCQQEALQSALTLVLGYGSAGRISNHRDRPRPGQRAHIVVIHEAVLGNPVLHCRHVTEAIALALRMQLRGKERSMFEWLQSTKIQATQASAYMIHTVGNPEVNKQIHNPSTSDTATRRKRGGKPAFRNNALPWHSPLSRTWYGRSGTGQTFSPRL